MRYPGYLLNPGDMFQVDPERVMFATGAPKSKTERRETRLERRKGESKGEDAEAKAEGAEESAEKGAEEGAAEGEGEKESAEVKVAEAKEEELDTRETLKRLMTQAKSVMSSDKSDLPAKRKQELRGFQKAVRRVLSRSESSNVLTGNLETQFSELLTLLKTKPAAKSSKDKASRAATETEAADPGTEDAQPGEKLTEAFQKAAENRTEEVDTSELSDDEVNTLKRALVQMRDNPIDSSKPYATPWRPRDYMSAFAFIQRYLEVSQNICAAVYLRHPVARPGFSEVPSPFSEGINTAAFTWYLRRR